MFTDTPADQANTTTAEVTVEATADADKDGKQEEPATLEAATDKQDQPVIIIYTHYSTYACLPCFFPLQESA